MRKGLLLVIFLLLAAAPLLVASTAPQDKSLSIKAGEDATGPWWMKDRRRAWRRCTERA